MRRPAWRPGRSGRAALAGAAVVAAVVAAAVLGRPGDGGAAPAASAMPLELRSPEPAAGGTVRVIVRLPRPALGELAHPPSGRAAGAYVRSLRMEAAALRGALGARGIPLTRVIPFGRTFDGFAADVPSSDLGRLSSLGVRTEPVRRFYPAAAAVVPPATPPAPAARGSSAPGVAVLTAGDPATPLLPVGPGARPVPIARPEAVPGQTRPEVAATTDGVIAGLEDAVAHHDAVALVTVAAPYAGFADAPEARAAAAALRLGTVVVAPAGNEDGPVASPAGAPAVVAVGAAGTTRLPAVSTPFGRGTLLGGRLPRDALPATVTGDGERGLFDRAGRSRVRGRIAIVRRGADPASTAAAAAAAGARAVVVADPSGATPFAAVDPARVGVPVVALAGSAARAALGAGGGSVRLASVPALAPAGPAGAFSARGGWSGVGKPDLLAPGAVRAGGALVAGTGVAAAYVARAAAALAAGDPALRGAALAAALRDHPPVPARAARVPPAAPPAPAAGPLRLRRQAGRVDGASIVLGSFDPGTPGVRAATVVPVGRLVLDLVTAAGRTARTLTPPGGATDLLPGEYAYTVPGGALRGLPSGGLRFRARIWAPGGRRPAVRLSPVFAR